MSNRFSNAGLVEQTVWEMRLADYPRGKNRALVDRLFNGLPPWQERDVDANNVKTNLNDLSAARYAADARRTLERAFDNAATYFTLELDHGPLHKRGHWQAILTKRINDILKESFQFDEILRSQIALKVLHGIGPVFWTDRYRWCPSAMAIQDVLIPSRTLRSMENLDHFAIFRQWTYEQLYKMTHGAKVDPGWQMETVNGALKWVKEQTTAYLQSYAQWYAPQNVEEIVKEDGGYMGTDALPTVDVWDFYYHCDEGGKEGWRRCVILDSPMSGEVGNKPQLPDKTKYGLDHGKWLYKPDENRVYANKLSQILHFQFGDATATAPFRYHSIRSLGWLLYPFCHLQNRLRSRFIDHLFENLNQYFRVNSQSEHERVNKLDLHNFGEIPDSTQFVKQEERWQINQQLVEMGFTQNRSLMDEAAAQYREGRETQHYTERETATAVMARVNAANALVGSLLGTMYKAAKFQYLELCRRFCQKDSLDPEVREFRAKVLRDGVPPEAINLDCWKIVPTQVLGSGNKMLEITMADKLMAVRALHDPPAQREILEIYDRAYSDNPMLAQRLAGTDRDKEISDSVKTAQLMVGTLMRGIAVEPQRGENPQEIIETLLFAMAQIMERQQQFGPKPEDLVGLQTMGATIGKYLQIFGQDKEQQNKAKEYAKDLSTLMAEVKKMGDALAKQQAEAAKAQAGPDPAAIAKAQATALQAQTKDQITKAKHQQDTQHSEVAFQSEQQRQAERHVQQLAQAEEKARLDAQLAEEKSAAEIRRQGEQTLAENAA